MKVTKIKIRDLFGITDLSLDGKSAELTGPKGAGKSSVLDSIRLALTNRSERDYIIRKGADEGEILIETDTGLSIDRKRRNDSADYISVREGRQQRTKPESFLKGIFTPLQLNPVEFTQMSRQEKNRIILSLIEFPWDMKWIESQFGEVPRGVDYDQHILQVLADIQADNGVYYQSRQSINRDIRNKQAFIEDIARTLPDNYNADKWDAYALGDAYRELDRVRESNASIQRAKEVRDNYKIRVNGIDGRRDAAIAAIDGELHDAKADLKAKIADWKARIEAAEKELLSLDERREERITTIMERHNTEMANLERDLNAALRCANDPIADTTAMEAEIQTAEAMKKHLNEYRRMERMQGELEALQAESEEYTRKIELARELPAQILAKSVIPVKGLTVENGIPLIHGLPISNLSDGELLELCVEITVCKPGQLGIILVDGAERLDTANRERLYNLCRDKGLQIIASRTTDSDVLEVTELD